MGRYTTMSEKKVSVIVPAYNSEPYIEQCVKSLLNQTYKNLEVIAVDDGSTDKTGSILDRMGKDDKRLKCIHTPNGGVTKARMIGLEYATGEYIGFCDSDDFAESDMYEFLMECVDKYQAELVHCGYYHITGEEKIAVKGTKKIYRQSREETLYTLLNGGLFTGSLCTKLYKKELFNGVQIDPKIRINEDILLNFYIMKKIEKSVYADVCKYNYVTREETGACLNTNFVEKARQGLLVNQLMFYELKHEAAKLEQLGYEKVIMAYIDLYRCILFDENIPNHEKKTELRKIRKHLWNCKKQREIKNKKNRITIYFFQYVPFIYKWLFKIYDKIRIKNIDV